MTSFFFFNDTATTEIYTLSLHDALPIYRQRAVRRVEHEPRARGGEVQSRDQLLCRSRPESHAVPRSEEHTSELQSRQYLVCRLLLEKKTISLPSPGTSRQQTSTRILSRA